MVYQNGQNIHEQYSNTQLTMLEPHMNHMSHHKHLLPSLFSQLYNSCGILGSVMKQDSSIDVLNWSFRPSCCHLCFISSCILTIHKITATQNAMNENLCSIYNYKVCGSPLICLLRVWTWVHAIYS